MQVSLKLKELPKSFIRLYHYFFGNSVTNPEFLIFFRITIGTIILAHFVSIFPDFEMLYGMQSIIPSDIHSVSINPNVLLYNELIEFLTTFTKSEKTSVIIFQGTYISLSIFIITGFFSRYSAILLLILQIALTKSSHYFSYGADFFTSMSLMYIALFPSDDYFSIRSYFWKTKRKSDLTPFRRTFQIHICIAYFVSGIEKLGGYNWRNGESIWKAVHLPGFPNDFNLSFNFLGTYPWVFVILGWCTIIIELFYPVFINVRKTKIFWLYFTVSLHLGIAIVLNLYFFSAIMITWNIANYYFEDQRVVA